MAWNGNGFGLIFDRQYIKRKNHVKRNTLGNRLSR